ncbi:chemotaxis protein CheD [Fulvivirga sp. 29W222]|uniref:Probable chemoreceptor glutamine deamidase CheD n=1 Tax=Fulvivirga marina TaxID=2494733 RepID=A0A937KEB9_9BACT|nr:chemotaxis protein CheD [Fulvivirga marina]MBL6447048.1 chemotaxis protein CheD [Fulvivirga marina]
MKQTHVLGLSEWAVSNSPGEIICFGLGSCVGVFLYDKFKRIGAGAHIMTPSDKCGGFNIITAMISEMLLLGSQPLTIRARLVGGANIFSMESYCIGKRNVDSVKKDLKKMRILIESEDLGGNESRTARLNISTGELIVSTPQQKFHNHINN